jgi:phenylalanyl-tRNA synthetase beta chain
MRVSFEWLKDFIDITASPQEVAERLTMAGLEVEAMEAFEGDIVFEINVTPNRPDCLSMLGVAREVAAAFGLTLRMPDALIERNAPRSDFNIEILDPELCNRYAGRFIRGVAVGDSPEWMKKRLEKCGIRSLNNIVDITNYVLLELGHPLHAFDSDRLLGRRIRVAKAGMEKSLTTLDGIERKLPEDALLIWDAKNVVAVAGVMGGNESGVSEDTRNIFLESAYFDPASIRRTGKRLGLKTESSYRFERGTDIEFLVNALNRAAILIKETGGGVIHEILDEYPKKYTPIKVEAGYDKINSLLGTSLKKDEIINTLSRIGLDAEDKGETLSVSPPSYRRDIRHYVDIVEEVARVHGYSKIPVRIPRTALSAGILNRKENIVGAMRESIRKAGFTEVINYSFMNPLDIDMLSIPAEDIRRSHLRVKNPLRQEESLMRTTLIASLLNNLAYNLSRDAKDIRFFEIAKIFINEGSRLPREETRLAGIFYSERIPSVWKEDVPAFFIVKGGLQALFEEMKVPEVSYVLSEEVFLHSGKSADIVIKGKRLGFMGEISPDVAERMNLKVHKPEIVVFELDIDMLLQLVPEKITYRQIPKYPSIERDIAIIMDEGLSSAQVAEWLRRYGSEFIENVELFDHYRGKNIPQGKKSLAFRITYRSPDRTLTDDEIETIHGELIKYILKKTGGELRA